MVLQPIGSGNFTLITTGPTNGTEQPYTANENVVVYTDDPNATLTNTSTGYSTTDGELVLKSSETVEWESSVDSHLYRTKE